MKTRIKTCVVLGLQPNGSVSLVLQTEDADEARRSAVSSVDYVSATAWKLDSRDGARLLKRWVNPDGEKLSVPKRGRQPKPPAPVETLDV